MQDSPQTDTTGMDRLLGGIQLILPTHMISRVVHWAARVETEWFKRLLINFLMRSFGITLDDAQVKNPNSFRSFNEFFTRALAPGARPMPANETALASPVDGSISQLGSIQSGRIVQAKGRDYSVLELVGGNQECASAFLGGSFCTIYLAPNNYHRIHMPLGGKLRDMVYVPGRLFSVSPSTARAIPNLFARNERVVSLFDTDAGPFAMVSVGALNVGSIETVWAGEITPAGRRLLPRVESTRYDSQSSTTLSRGEEMGRFNLGSTVVMLFGPGAIEWNESVQPGTAVRLGQEIGIFNSGT